MFIFSLLTELIKKSHQLLIQFVCLSVCLQVYLSIFVVFYFSGGGVSVCLSVRLCLCVSSLHVSILIFISLFCRLCVPLSVSVCLFASVLSSVCLSVYTSSHMSVIYCSYFFFFLICLPHYFLLLYILLFLLTDSVNAFITVTPACPPLAPALFSPLSPLVSLPSHATSVTSPSLLIPVASALSSFPSHSSSQSQGQRGRFKGKRQTHGDGIRTPWTDKTHIRGETQETRR